LREIIRRKKSEEKQSDGIKSEEKIVCKSKREIIRGKIIRGKNQREKHRE
jgi:hypothetical protein